MPPSQNQEEVLFALALEKTADLRSAFLDALCADDPAMRQRLEGLLVAHEQAETLVGTQAEAAQSNLAALIHGLPPGEEILITENERPIAKLVATPDESQLEPRVPGALRGTVLYMAPDFDAPLDDFKEYME